MLQRACRMAEAEHNELQGSLRHIVAVYNVSGVIPCCSSGAYRHHMR